ncbi:MAG: exo-alpha-sialidase, partial [Clostridia bacterium]|nr:exo-alpha-sialidase [Clostridia bacterium]
MLFHEELIFPSDGVSNYRIPSLVVTGDGTVLAFCNNRKNTLRDHAEDTALVCAKKCPGQAWTKPITLMEHEGVCCLIGSAVYDRETDTSFVFVKRKFARYEFEALSDEEALRLEKEDEARAKRMGLELGNFQMVSRDSGRSWSLEKVCEQPFEFLHINGETVRATLHTHGGSHGVQLRHGEHKGRLLCPSRIFAGRYTSWEDIRNFVYNNAVYSDDHGKTWHVSAPVQLGTGEGTLIELKNGEILYNSRAYFADGKR